MALGDGIRRNIASVDPSERAMLRDALLALNDRFFPGVRTDAPAPGGVTWWFKQDEIHQATHVHGGPEFIPWHREIVNRLEEMLRQINPQLSLHYWDWKEDPRAIPNANLGGGTTGTLNLFTSDFMGYGGSTTQVIGPPWQNAAAPWRNDGFYVPGISPDRDSSPFNPADPPTAVNRSVVGSPITAQTETDILNTIDFADMRLLMESAHNDMHGFVRMGGVHISFRDPFVFLLHSGQDRLYSRWQTDPAHPGRLNGATVYGRETGDPSLNGNVEPWSTGHSIDTFGQEHFTRPWYAPENQGVPHTYKSPSIVFPPCYDTNLSGIPLIQVMNAGSPPVINFNDVPEGETAARAVVFSVYSCADVHLSITSGPTVVSGATGTSFGTLLATSLPVPHILSLDPPLARFWISYKGTHANDVATGSLTVHCDETNQDFVINITANTIARKTVATMLVLDQSGSMDWLAGIDSTTKRIDILHQAATQFVQLAQDSSRIGDGVGMVSFDNNAYPGIGVTRNNGTGFDLAPVVTAIQNLHPQGATSIGNGVALARNTLNPVTGYDVKAMVVFTDGLENTSLFIADVMGSINDQTFAIGLGTVQQVSVGALTALANNTGGRLLLSGRLSPAIDDYFRLSKFFMQVLAGVKNDVIVTDPSGYISPGMKVRIPFVLNETDIDTTVILLTDLRAIRFMIETPAGDIMTPAQAGALGATYAVGANMSYYRFTLPLPLGAKPAQGGTWYALLELDEKLFQRYTMSSDQTVRTLGGRFAHGIRYNVSAQAFSNLRMHADLSQNSLQPGATLTVRATLSEYGIPVDHRAIVLAKLERPDNSQATIALAEIEPGIFEATTAAPMQGVYRFHILAGGATMRGLPFTREQDLSGAVVLGGDNPPPTSGPSTHTRDTEWCDLLECLLGPDALGRFLSEHNINPNAVRDCIERWCKQRLAGPSPEELREREGTSAAPVAATGAIGQLSPSDVASLLADILSGAQPIPGTVKDRLQPSAPARKHKQ
jgi:Common central domain of tyrosinase/von Willebrand factor type A domain